MIAPWAKPATVSGPKSLIRPEKFTEGLQNDEVGAAGDHPATPALRRVTARSGGLDLLVLHCVATLVELERPHLDQAGVELTGRGELVRVRDALVVHRGEVGVELLRGGVTGVDALQEDVR